ncbi:MAG: hypothetical protein ACRD96_04835, partial [Bryobacteraceae bacterium]
MLPVLLIAIACDIQSSLRELEQVSGLKTHKRVRHETIARGDVERFLKTRVKEVTRPEEIRAEEITLKKLGFVPADFNLETTTVDLLAEQAAAFYDFRKRRLFLIDVGSADMREMALVHELAHALADQNFRLERFLKQAGRSDDGALARLAVMEGQASWLTAEVLARQRSDTLVGQAAAIERLMESTASGAAQFPVFNTVPLYLRETLVFPYTHGMRFQHALVERLGQAAFAEIFRRPPASTQQILHPEKYFAGVLPSEPAPPRMARSRGFKSLAQGSLGELDHMILLRQYATRAEADEVAPRLRGGAYAVWERKSDARFVLGYVSEWDTEDVARRFFG